jgi:hypothetical protein
MTQKASLSIVPGASLGPYQLGDELNETLSKLDKNKEQHTIKHNRMYSGPSFSLSLPS